MTEYHIAISGQSPGFLNDYPGCDTDHVEVIDQLLSSCSRVSCLGLHKYYSGIFIQIATLAELFQCGGKIRHYLIADQTVFMEKSPKYNYGLIECV